MTIQPEVRIGNGEDFVAQTRDEVRQEIQAAQGNNAREVALAQKIQQEIKDAETPAKEVVQAGAAGQLDQRRQEGTQVLRTLIRATEAAKAGIPVGHNAQSQSLLTELSEKSLSISTASAIESQLKDYLLGEKTITISASGQPPTEFEQAYVRLVQTNTLAASVLSQSLIHAAEVNRLGSLDTDLVRQKFAIDQRVEQRVNEGYDGHLSYQDRSRFEDLSKKILTELDNNLNATNLPEDRKLSRQEQVIARRFYNGNEERLNQVEAIFSKLGIPRAELDNYKGLRDKAFPIDNVLAVKGMMTSKELTNHLEKAINEFTIDNLKGERLQILSEDPNGSGKLVLDRRAFKKMINQYYYLALKDIHKDYSKDWSKAFDQWQHGYYFGGLKGVIGNLCTNLRGLDLAGADIGEFLDDVKGRYQASILSYAEIFHNLPLYARDPSSFEKWGAFLGYLFPSELAEVFDPQDKIMEIARHEVTIHLRQRIALNNNKIPPDLFAGNYETEGVRYGNRDRANIIKVLKERMEALGIKTDDWEYERAITYALGIGIANLMDPEVICTADPQVNADFKGIYPLAQVLSAKHNWGLGRGYPVSGLFPDLVAMPVTLFPEQRGFISRLFRRKAWVPEKFHKYAKGQEAKYGDKIYGALIDREGKYKELMNMVNIGTSLNSRHGWRISPIRDAIKGYVKDGHYGLKKDMDFISRIARNDGDEGGWGAKEWEKYEDICMGLYGSAALWWMAGPRQEGELKRLLAQHVGSFDQMTASEWEAYSLGSKALKKEFKVMINGSFQTVSMGELRLIRNYQIRGETFYRYSRRNPGDFIMLLGQLCPEMLDLKTDYLASRVELEAALKGKHKPREDIEKALALRDSIYVRWGETGFAQLRQIRLKLLGLCQKYANETGVGKRFANQAAVIEYFVKESGTAFEKALKDKEPDRKIEGKTIPGRSRLIVQRSDFTDSILADFLFADSDGLLSLIPKEDFGGFDENNKFSNGKHGFFFRMGEMWTLKQGDINPFASDMNHFGLYENIGKVGEDVAKRYLSDADAVSKMLHDIGQLDKLLMDAAHDGDLSKIFELHDKVHTTLKNIISQEYAWKANYIMSQIVAQFFLEHQTARLPLIPAPIRSLFGLMLDRNISLSKLVTQDRHAKTWDENAARDYFKRLAERHSIPFDGLWSANQLNQAFDAETKAFVAGETILQFMYSMIMFLLWSYLKKAFEESQGKKQ